MTGKLWLSDVERAENEMPSVTITDAMRYRWLKQHLQLFRDGYGEWTCWLHLPCIPYRLTPTVKNPEALLDELIRRFPLDEKSGGEKSE